MRPEASVRSPDELNTFLTSIGDTACGCCFDLSLSRVLRLDAATTTLLRQHRVDQLAERLAWGSAWERTGLLFTREDGSALRPDYVSHLFAKLAKRSGVPRIRLHDLRHTIASSALAAGVPLKVVRNRLSHSSTAITSDLYTHT